jgi:hypothetical protein
MKSWLSTTCILGLTAALPTGVLAASPPEFIELTNGNSIYQADLLRFSEDQSWLVDGIETLFTDLYFLNVDADSSQRDLRLEDLQLVELSQPASNRVNASLVTFGGSLNLALDSILLGGAPGSYSAMRQETVTLTNTGQDWLDVSLFKYIDYDLQFDDSIDNDTAVFTGNTLTQADTSGALATLTVDQDPTAVQIGPYGPLLAELYNPPATNLQDSPGPVVDADITAALQFDRILAPGESSVFRFVMTVQGQDETKTVPESGTVFALGVVAAGLALLRRRF